MASEVGEDVLDSLRAVTSPTLFAELEARVEFGVRKYGTRLKTFNGRDVLLDCRQEALDGIMYSQQAVLQGLPYADALRNAFIHLAQCILKMEKENNENRTVDSENNKPD
jgi:hypothetical protein